MFFIEFIDKCGGDMLGVVVVCQQFIEYSVEVYDQCEVVKGVVNVVFDGDYYFIQWYILY